jgi:hypothetical protein
MAEGQVANAVATCCGSPFKVYATKDYPGLETSTELTMVGLYSFGQSALLIIISSLQHLSRLGVQVNTRTAERRKKQ